MYSEIYSLETFITFAIQEFARVGIKEYFCRVAAVMVP